MRREVVKFIKSRGHTERRACELASLQRSTCRYQSRREDDPKLVARLRKIAEERPRFGYRRVHALLQREGFEESPKRVYCTCRAAGLAVKRRSRRKLHAVRPRPTVAVTRPNERWSTHFVHDYLGDGRKLRTFNVVDAFTRECLAIAVDTSLPARRIIPVLDQLVWRHGLPQSLRVDNGPEFISVAMERWAAQHGLKLDFIQPGKPTQNAHVESFNGRFRDECLAQARFPTLARARVEIELWRVDYNTERPHSALDYRTPKAFGDLARCRVPASPGAAAAIFGGDQERGARDRARERVQGRIEINEVGIPGSTSGVRSGEPAQSTALQRHTRSTTLLTARQRCQGQWTATRDALRDLSYGMSPAYATVHASTNIAPSAFGRDLRSRLGKLELHPRLGRTGKLRRWRNGRCECPDRREQRFVSRQLACFVVALRSPRLE